MLTKNCFSVYVYSRRSGQYTMNHDHSKKTPDGASFDRSGSQDSLDELSMDDYWKELENIHETRGNNHEERVALVVKEPDGNEIYSCEWSSVCWFRDFSLSLISRDGTHQIHLNQKGGHSAEHPLLKILLPLMHITRNRQCPERELYWK